MKKYDFFGMKQFLVGGKAHLDGETIISRYLIGNHKILVEDNDDSFRVTVDRTTRVVDSEEKVEGILLGIYLVTY